MLVPCLDVSNSYFSNMLINVGTLFFAIIFVKNNTTLKLIFKYLLYLKILFKFV